jgi:hypothetical protein
MKRQKSEEKNSEKNKLAYQFYQASPRGSLRAIQVFSTA